MKLERTQKREDEKTGEEKRRRQDLRWGRPGCRGRSGACRLTQLSGAKKDVWGLSCLEQKHMPLRQNPSITFCISVEMSRIPGNYDFLWPTGWALRQALLSIWPQRGRGGGADGGLEAWAMSFRHCWGRAGSHGVRGALTPCPRPDLGIPGGDAERAGWILTI